MMANLSIISQCIQQMENLSRQNYRLFFKKKAIGINTLLLLKPWFTDNAFSEQKKPILQLNKEIVDYLWKRFLPEERKALEYCFR